MIRFFSNLLLITYFAIPLYAQHQIITYQDADYSGSKTQIERWSVLQLNMDGPRNGNPFVDVTLSAEFIHGDKTYTPSGFYDGNGVYSIRFMPDEVGEWSFITRSNRAELDNIEGTFLCTDASPGNHGPVRVRTTFYLAYEDGTPYFQIGTTSYAWAHQGERIEQQTLRTLADAPFNKMRMCVFPKDYVYNQNEPFYYPFEGEPLKDWDFTRFNPAFWQHFESRVMNLLELGIEADVILFHTYDRWGFEYMDKESDDRYIRYAVARLSAFRNVWWSLANEYDFMPDKEEADWDRFFQIIQQHDPYRHMRGIHNGARWYDHTKPWVTHASVQSSDFSRAIEWRNLYRKPVIYDECRYEGDIPRGWGNISARDMVNHFWMGTMGGTYVGHGETYLHPEDRLWWAKGGELRGESPARIAFLKEIMSEAPAFEKLFPTEPVPGIYVLAEPGYYYLIYFTEQGTHSLELPEGIDYKLDVIDTWQMTVRPLGSARKGLASFTAPRSHYLLRLTPYASGDFRRPEVTITATPDEGIGSLDVQFTATSSLSQRWNFGDGVTSEETDPRHHYVLPGEYIAEVIVTNPNGSTAGAYHRIVVHSVKDAALVRVGFLYGDTHPTLLNGPIIREKDGSYTFGSEEPWGWISFGEEPLAELEGLQSFTVMGWIQLTDLQAGSGGNRFVYTLNGNRNGFDLVHLEDGRMRLAVNEWPDGVTNDSSPGRLEIGKWTFFAVTYNSAQFDSNVSFYFGDADTAPFIDNATNYSNGSTGSGSGPLSVGNYNETIHHAGLDRQLRGRLRSLTIHGSKEGRDGALRLPAIIAFWNESRPSF